MALSICSLKASSARRHWTRLVAIGLVAAVALYDSTAYAINALVSQDLPLLTQIAATEASSYLELGSILSEAAAIVAEVKEYTTIAKTVYGDIQAIRDLSWSDLETSVMEGLNNAFPELGEMYGDIEDIRDLDYRNAQAAMTIRGALWEGVYGPAIDYLHAAHTDLDVVADAEEHRGRQVARVAVSRAKVEHWQDECNRAAEEDGVQGACSAAAQRAEIESALMLQDLHETELQALRVQERMLANEDRKELDGIYAFDRLVFDFRNYVASAAGIEERCVAGRCLYQRYGSAVYQRVAEFQARHPSRGMHWMPAPDDAADGEAP